MKKFFAITGIIIAGILVVVLSLPFLFHEKIKETIKEEANKMLNARVDFVDVRLSFIKNFPDATIFIGGLTVIGTGEFESDTLIRSMELSASINPASLLGNAGYELKKIRIYNTSVYAKVLEDGKVNWDIVKPSEEETTTPEDTATATFSLKLAKIEIRNLDIVYDDRQSDMKVIVRDFSGTLKGDMTASVTNLETKSTVEELTFVMNKITCVNNVTLSADLVLQADFARQKYTLQQSTIGINAIRTTIDGWVAMPDSSTTEMDLKLDAPQIRFKDLLSLIPAVYAKDFEGLKADGEVQLSATARGVMQGASYPACEILLSVRDGSFRYPALPESLDDIQVSARIGSAGGVPDNLVVDIDRMHFKLGENPFDLRLKIARPMTDLQMDFTANGMLNLGMVKDFYPLEKGMKLNGMLNVNVSFAGAMSSIERGAYDKFDASGTLALSDMTFHSEEFPEVRIGSASFAFNPKYAELSKVTVAIGKNDLSAAGRLENYLPYILKDQTIKGSLKVSSNYLNVNDFMAKGEVAASTTQDSVAPMLAFEVPKNIRFDLDANLKDVIFDDIRMKDVNGHIVVDGGKIDMKNLSMNALGGTMKVNGYYSTADDPRKPEVDLGLDLKQVSFSETFKAFGFVKNMMPIFEHMAGNYSVGFNIKTSLTENMSPVLTALTGSGLLQSNDVSVDNVAALTALASALKNDKLKTFKTDDLKVPFTIANGRVNTSPFDVRLGDTKMSLSGSTGLDQTIDYVAKVSLPDGLTKGKLSHMNVKIGGTFTSPKVSIDTKSLVEDALSSALKNALPGDAGNIGATVDAEIEKQAAALRRQAQDAGAKLIDEAEKQGKKLIDEANRTGNPLLKIAAVSAAEAAAQKLKNEAQKQAEKLNAEAEKQIENLSNGAKEKAK
jgi:hypothetical protein